MDRELILASASPRRSELLRLLGWPFTVYKPVLPEIAPRDAAPETVVEQLSLHKAREAAEVYPGRVILAADTLVYCQGAPLGKPAGAEDAARMLHLLSGREHSVYTGVCVVDGRTGKTAQAWDAARVRFAPMTDGEIAWYIGTGEPMDKAGAYALQGAAAAFITGIDGSPSTVIGLPLHLVYQMLNLVFTDRKQ